MDDTDEVNGAEHEERNELGTPPERSLLEADGDGAVDRVGEARAEVDLALTRVVERRARSREEKDRPDDGADRDEHARRTAREEARDHHEQQFLE